MNIGIIIQARMGSSRLPGKVMKPIAGKPLLEHIIGRLSQLKKIAVFVVATSSLEGDNPIFDWCIQNKVKCFRGSEDDVLDRYFSCSKKYRFDVIVRLTADNPFTDIAELDRLIDLHIKSKYDYTHSFGILPIGIGAEVLSFYALRKSYLEGKEQYHREQVNDYIFENPQLFRIGVLDVPSYKSAPDLRLTVDTEEGWRRADTLARQAQGDWLDTQKAIAICLSSA